MYKACVSLNQSCEILACKRRQKKTEESQYYQEQKGCLYGSEIAD